MLHSPRREHTYPIYRRERPYITTSGYKICNAVGSKSLTKERYYLDHKREQHQAYNQSRYKDAASCQVTRFYKSADWKQIRKVVLQREMCTFAAPVYERDYTSRVTSCTIWLC